MTDSDLPPSESVPRDEILTLAEVARHLRVHPNTVYRLARKGALPGFKVGSDWRFARSTIDAWRTSSGREAVPTRTPVPDPPLDEELLHVLYWYAEALGTSWVRMADLRLFVDRAPAEVRRALSSLTAASLVGTTGAAGRERFCLTPEGHAEAGRRYAPKTVGHLSMLAAADRQTPPE